MEGMKWFNSAYGKLTAGKNDTFILELPDCDTSQTLEDIKVDGMVLFGDNFCIQYKLEDGEWVVEK